MRSPTKFLHEYVWRDWDILAVSLLSGSAAAWTHVMNTSKKEIAGEKFIFDVGSGNGVGWSLITSIEQCLYAIPPAPIHAPHTQVSKR